MNAPVGAARPAPKLSARARTRLWWMRIHRWLGVGLLLVFLAIGLSGMVLVSPGTVETLVHPGRAPVATGDARATPARLVAAGRAAMPGGALPVQLAMTGATGTAILTGEPNGPPILGVGPPRRPRVWIDPVDAKVLSVSQGGPDVMFVARAIHGHLLVAGFGRWLMAAAGLMLVVSSATGIYLWWPGRKNILRSLKWRKQFTKSMNIHRVVGPLAGLGLLAQGLTGIFMALPWLLAAMAPASPKPAVPPPPAPGSAKPLPAPARQIDAVVAQGDAMAAGKKLVTIQFPSVKDSNWWLAYQGGVTVAVDDASGKAMVRNAPPPTPAQELREANSKLHEGGYGLIHQILLFATGAAFCLFSITGILLWSQGRKRKTPR